VRIPYVEEEEEKIRREGKKEKRRREKKNANRIYKSSRIFIRIRSDS